MSFVRTALKVAGGGLRAVLLLLALAFSGLQTGSGKSWLAGALSQAMSSNGERAVITDIGGVVPFNMTIARIEMLDDQGPRALVENGALVIAPGDLLKGTLTINRLAAERVRLERPSQGGGSTNLESLLHPPLALRLDELRVDRLELGPAMVGQPVSLALAASASLLANRATADLDLHRIDGIPGEVRLHAALAGTPPQLELNAAASEPTGRILADLTGSTEPLPLVLNLEGAGPLDDWRGALRARAGDAAHIDADFRLTDSGRRVNATGAVEIAAALPAQWRPLAAGGMFSLAVGLDDKTIAIDEAALATAAFALTAHGRFDPQSHGMNGEARLTLPDLAPLSPLAGTDMRGSLTAMLSIAGPPAATEARLSLQSDGLGTGTASVKTVEAVLNLVSRGDPLAAATPLALDGNGSLRTVTLEGAPLPGGLGDQIKWRLRAEIDRAAPRIELRELAISDAANTLSAAGAGDAGGIAGKVHLALADLGRFAGAALAGSLALDADVRADRAGAVNGALTGTLQQPPSDTIGARLLGSDTRLAATLARSADGALSATDIAIEGAHLAFSGEARRGVDGAIAARYRLTLPELAALSNAVAGRARISGEASGPIDALSATASIEAEAVKYGGATLYRVEGPVRFRNPKRPIIDLDLAFRGEGVAGKLAAAGELVPGETLRLTQLRLEGPETRLAGDLTVGLKDHGIAGTIAGDAKDLSVWSKLLGQDISGAANLKLALAAPRGQNASLALEGSNLNVAGAAARRLRVSADLTDLFANPAGRASLALDHASMGEASVEELRLQGKSERPGRFAGDVTARGKAVQSFTLATAAAVTLGEERQELRINRLIAKWGADALALHRPLLLSRRGSDLAFVDLDLGFGAGRVSGDGAVKGSGLALHLLVRDLPVASLSAPVGQFDISGTLGAEFTLAGTRQKPEGTLVIDGEQLRFAAARRPDLPPLGLVVAAQWRGERVTLKGRLAGPKNAALGFAGEAPLSMDPARLAVHVPAAGRLSLRLEGEGELANLVDLLPIGEDRLAGLFTIDVSVAGTVGAPVASGKLSVRNGRYEAMATGTTLAGISFDLVGNRDRLVLENFAATDGAQGRLSVNGAVNLAALAFDVSGELQKFRALQSDAASATVSGALKLSGDITALHFAARLRVERADIRVPERLPQSARPIPVTIIDSATGQVIATPEAKTAPAPRLAVALDVVVELPGQVFVRGRGLDSEWRGRIAASGTSAAPVLEGKLEVVRGTYDFVGKTAQIARGTITFLGGNRIDPEINIEARVSSTGVTAIVQITGTATQPSIKLSSQPELPQDEILARVLFGSSIGQLSPAQGLEIAQAAASLATGGDPGVLDRIRQGLGLDRLTLGGPNSNPNSALNGVNAPQTGTPAGIPSAFPTAGIGSVPLPAGAGATSPTGTAVSAGKYVANGVYVGVTQGLGAGSSSVDVQIDVTRHISVDTTTGQDTGTGIGLNWKLDY
ncbi:MAG TPA: translocation/assembly module TamB domain-containing protein [Stellaceae bacterium]|nr:translocation/assembly module TamB domain-containing protein [Stellaceae bacterium]